MLDAGVYLHDVVGATIVRVSWRGPQVRVFLSTGRILVFPQEDGMPGLDGLTDGFSPTPVKPPSVWESFWAWVVSWCD